MPDASPPPFGRRRALILATAAFAVVAVIWLVWSLIMGGRYVTTDNAYVETPSVTVTALIPGPVTRVNAVDTQMVKAGDVLVELDATDATLARTMAEAQLQMVTRKVRTYYATDTSLRSQQGVADSNLKAAGDAVAQAQAAIKAAGANATPELQKALVQAQAAEREARARVLALRGQTTANADLIDRGALKDHPEIVAAQAQLQQATVAEGRAVIRAPVAGVVAKSDVGVGQFVLPGVPLMTLVPVDQAWVDANFKEAQLRKVRTGQSVTLTSDLYGRGVKFHGKVAGISGGTGSTLALIPAQNATGNWVKVVQRLPVRITLSGADLGKLRTGMSVGISIDTGKNRMARLFK